MNLFISWRSASCDTVHIDTCTHVNMNICIYIYIYTYIPSVKSLVGAYAACGAYEAYAAYGGPTLLSGGRAGASRRRGSLVYMHIYIYRERERERERERDICNLAWGSGFAIKTTSVTPRRSEYHVILSYEFFTGPLTQ